MTLSNFQNLIQTLLEDPEERHRFFQVRQLGLSIVRGTVMHQYINICLCAYRYLILVLSSLHL